MKIYINKETLNFIHLLINTNETFNSKIVWFRTDFKLCAISNPQTSLMLSALILPMFRCSLYMCILHSFVYCIIVIKRALFVPDDQFSD